ncbi:MAG: C39 family peptidase [Patescibacteria group bacterium]
MKKIIFLYFPRPVASFAVLLGCIFIFLFLAGCARRPDFVSVNINNSSQEASLTPNTQPPPNLPLSKGEGNGAGREAIEVPSKFELSVSFASQAPFANWDALHEEACEEAAMIMAAKYFKKQPLNETIMEEEIQKLVKWEEENGYEIDLTAEEMADILKNYFGLSASVNKEVTVDRIKYEISRGNLVIAPAAGRDLHNPNFKQPGPIYHALVIKGYNNSEFITNDPGTRKGNGFRYPYNILISAVHNWDHLLGQDGMSEEEMRQGERVMIVVNF